MLPSTRRPKEVEEERAARLAEIQRQLEKPERLILRISKTDIFKKIMTEWYEKLQEAKKKRLTAKDLKRKAISVCYSNNMAYENLPANWVKECGIKVYMKNKEKKKDESGGKKKELTVENKIRHQPKRGCTSEKTEPVPSSSSSVNNEDQDAKNLADKSPGQKIKVFDLSTITPPAAWTKSCAAGIEHPRVLITHQKGDTNVVFYDYDPKLQDCQGNKVSLAPKPCMEPENHVVLLPSNDAEGHL